MNDKLNEFNRLKVRLERLLVTGTGLIAIGIFTFLYSMINLFPAFSVTGVFIFIVGSILSIKGGSDKKKLSARFKQEVLADVFRQWIPGIEFFPNSGLSQSVVYDTGFLKRADHFFTEDFIAGKIENVDFISSDVKLEERHVRHTKNGTQVYYVTYFLGRIFRFSFNKEFDGQIMVLEAGAPVWSGFRRIELESVDFNQRFKTYSTNDLSAFYVLTPDIMEAIMKLESQNPGKISMSFTGETLYIAINNNIDTFELKLFQQINQSMIEQYIRDLLVIRELITVLKLNNRLFKKPGGN